MVIGVVMAPKLTARRLASQGAVFSLGVDGYTFGVGKSPRREAGRLAVAIAGSGSSARIRGARAGWAVYGQRAVDRGHAVLQAEERAVGEGVAPPAPPMLSTSSTAVGTAVMRTVEARAYFATLVSASAAMKYAIDSTELG